MGAAGGDRHGVADGGAVQGDGAVAADHGGTELGNWLVGPGFDDLHAAGDDIAGTDGCLEVPVHVQEDGARAGQALRHHGVEDGAGDAALQDDLAEPRRLRRRGVVMQGVAVSADLGEPVDVIRADRPGQFGGRADRGRAAGPAGCHGSVLSVTADGRSFGLIWWFRTVRAGSAVMGPAARARKAYRQPVTAAISGIAWIVTMVSRNPLAVWAVSAVPR